MRQRLRIPVAAVLALAALSAPTAAPAAAPAWHAVVPPVDDFPSGDVALRFDPLGTAFASWPTAQLATRPSAGAFTSPITFPTSPIGFSVFGFAANGDGTFVGSDGTTVRAAFRPAGSANAFGTVQTVAGGGFASVAVNAGGQALAAWDPPGFSSGAIGVAFRPAGSAGAFVTERLDTAGSPRASTLGLAGAALDADGSGVVAYRAENGTIQSIARSEGGSWSGPTQLSAGAVAGLAVLAANTAGDAVAVWNEGETVKAAVRPHDGAFGAAQTVASDSRPNALAASSVAMAADGTALVALERHTQARFICNGRISQIYTAELVKRSGGGWSFLTRQEGHSGRVAASPTGDGVAFAWEGFVDPCTDIPTHAIHAQLGTLASLGADTLLPDQPPGTITDTANTDQEIAIDGAGNAIVTWSATRPTTGGGGKLRVVAFDTGSAPPGGRGGSGGGGSGGSGGGSAGGGGGDAPPGPDFTDLLGLRAPVRNIPVDLGSGLPTNVFVDARCIARTSRCEVNANGVITGSYHPARASAARKRARATTFSIALPRVHATVSAGRSARLKLTIRGRALAKVRAALRAHGTAKLTVALTVNGVRRPKPIAIPFVAARARGRHG